MFISLKEKIKNTLIPITNDKSLCGLGVHSFEGYFMPFYDQPFEDDEECIVEGIHTFKCSHCGFVRDVNASGEFFNTPFVFHHEKIYKHSDPDLKTFIFHCTNKYFDEHSLKSLIRNKGEKYAEKVMFFRVLPFFPIEDIYNSLK